MRITLHIFMKDTRRLRLEIAVTVALLAYLCEISTGNVWMPFRARPRPGLICYSALAWAFLLALLFHQEPLVGDRQFWLTRPYSRHGARGRQGAVCARVRSRALAASPTASS